MWDKTPHSLISLNKLRSAINFFYQNVPALVRMFKITGDQAKSIMAMCPNYQSYALPSVGAGVSPRRLSSLHLWQMDVTHYTPFGCLKYIHVSIDTFPGAVFSSAHTNKKTKYVIKYYLLAFSTLGIPQETKTYMSHQFHQFLNQWGTGILHSPTGQSIIERACHSIKRVLDQQRGAVQT